MSKSRQLDLSYEVQKRDRRTWVTIARGDSLWHVTSHALKIAKKDCTDVRVRDYGKLVVFTAHKDGSYRGHRAHDDYGDGGG
jgi:hypothetical protein